MTQFKLETSPNLGHLQPSMTLGITAKAKALAAEGHNVASLCAGEPDFDTPEHIKEAAIAALRAGDTKYTPATGRADLKAAIADKLREENDVPAEAGQVIVAPGAKFSVFSAVAALCSEGDEVLLPVPFWLSYAEMVHAAGATAVLIPTRAENDYCPSADDLRDKITERTKLLILNTPSNPTGGLCCRASLESIAELACKHNFMVLADEIYEKLVYDPGHEHVSIASLGEEIAQRTITVNGFSKAYSMTGWRLGYLHAPKWLTDRIGALQSHSTSNPTSFAQAGALAALNGPSEPVDTMRNAFRERRDLIHSLLSGIEGVNVTLPRGAFYIFADISSFGLDSMTFADRCLNEAELAVIPGKPFGVDTHVRLSYAYGQETITEACGRLRDFCATLRNSQRS
ncbi:MAG: pyridoxal phosphate-dependent aminotransferase [Verrucomicrobiota bacterium]